MRFFDFGGMVRRGKKIGLDFRVFMIAIFPIHTSLPGVGLDDCIRYFIFLRGTGGGIKRLDFGFQGSFPYPDCQAP